MSAATAHDSPSSDGHQGSGWHALGVEETLRRLDTTTDGLTSGEAAARLEQHGPNELPRAAGDTIWSIVWRQVNDPLIWVLIASSGIAILADPDDGLKNGLVILAVVILNTVIGFVQEYRASKAIASLAGMVPVQVTALRDGQSRSLPARELVPGDVVRLEAGDQVPADLRLIHVTNLTTDEAALTGESLPVAKRTEPVPADAELGDRSDLAFGGTLVTAGTATAAVVGTGRNTQLGRISEMLGEATELQTPLTKALAVIGKWITAAILAVAALMLVVGTWRTYGAMESAGLAAVWTAFRESIIFAIALAVGAIPEGLPAIVTIALAIGVRRMAARRAIIRKLPAVETLGSTTVICTDKTGTLTRNEMTVQHLWTPGGEYEVTGVGYAPDGEIRPVGSADAGEGPAVLPPEVEDLLAAGVLASDATVARSGDRTEGGAQTSPESAGAGWTVSGDPTEGAMVVAARKAGLDAERLRRDLPRLDAVPFESERQYMASLHRRDGARIASVKGAPEVLLARCADAGRNDLQEVLDRLTGRGMRVLAVAKKRIDADELTPEDLEDGLELVGLQAMIDPPREAAVQAVEACHAAGITVKMITGDHVGTARAIGERIGIATGAGAVRGADIEAASDEELTRLIRDSNVFARVAPEHKLRIVKALQAEDQVVAMTGDGVNDAPALKQANIGVAMGITGTAVSKESADIVLTDDNFASIAAAVEEGRRVYDNLLKSLAFVLPTNLGLAFILMWAVSFFPFQLTAAGVELLLPMTPAQILWINLVATVALALPLAFEAAERDVMRRPPRDPGAPVLTPFVIRRTVLTAALMTAGAIGMYSLAHGWAGGAGLAEAAARAEARTMAVTTVIMFEIFYLWHSRSFRASLGDTGLFTNRTVFVGIPALLLLQAGFIYLPFMNVVFDSAPLSALELLAAAGVGAVILPVISAEKWISRRRAG